jgi:ATP:ADP antiporter, AAA family
MASAGLAPVRLTPFERALSLFTSVRPGEGRTVFLMLAQVFLLLHGYYLIRLVRETLILVEGSAEIRAYANGTIALTLIFIIPLYRLLFNYLKRGGDKSAVLFWVGSFFITNLLAFAFLVSLGVPVAVPFFIWVGIYNVMVIAQFWAFAADLLNIKSGQRLFAVIMVGAALGALTGSQVAGRLYPVIGVTNLMLLSALMLGAVLALSRIAERSVPEGSRAARPDEQPAAPANIISQVLGGFSTVARSGYLVRIALFIVLVNLINTNGTYILATFLSGYAAQATAASAGALTAGAVISKFYGDFYAAITALQILVQLFLVSRIFRWFGVRGAILVLPAIMVLNYGLIFMFPVFALVRFMMIIEMTANYSIQNTANHTLYLPVTREEKYVGKTTIDTFFVRFGDLVQAMLVFVVAQWLGLEVGWIIAINLCLALVLVALGSAIGRYHHGEIKHNLENMPPVIQAPLPDVYVPAGQILAFSIPDQAFMDPDPGDSLRYGARLANGDPLPQWIRFDRFNQTFTVRPPAGRAGSESIELTATDFEGLSVQAVFGVEYGADPVPRFSVAPSAAPLVPAGPQPAADGGMAPATPRSPE